MTKVQKAILAAVQHPEGHLTADEVYMLVKKQFPKVALGTIYRNLNYFADAQLIRRVARAGGPDYFESNTSAHDHVICSKCGNMMDLYIPELKDFLKNKMQCEIVSFDLTVSCVCNNCAEGKCEH